MRFQLLVDFDAETFLEAGLIASIAVTKIRTLANETGEPELVDRCPDLTMCEVGE